MAPPQPQGKVFDSIRQDIHTLDSKISLIAQKLKTIEQNEEIIGRTIVGHNEKLRELDEKASAPPAASSGEFQGGTSTKDLEDLKRQVEDLRKELGEMRYVINSINPLDYATLDQVRELLNEKKA
jgi:chromosome segregation ATPase